MRPPTLLEQMEAAGKVLTRARQGERRARNEARFLVGQALQLDESVRPAERRMARALGVSRETIRAWLEEARRRPTIGPMP